MARILTCVPPQQHTLQSKLDWLEATAADHRPDLFIMPQEYFGGMMMPQQMAFTEAELRPWIEDFALRYSMGVVACLVEKCEDGKNRERMWLVDPVMGVVGKQTKFALPSYSLAATGGTYQTYPETDLRNRAVAHEINGIKVGVFFCWEVFSDFVMFALNTAEPDLVATTIKFGSMAYPVNEGNKKNGKHVREFAFSSGKNIWEERLRLASIYELSCPLFVSTNTWRLPPKSEPMCGKLPSMVDDKGSLWKPIGAEAFHVQVDEIDVMKVRGLRENKWTYKEMTGEWPPYSALPYTMWRKIHRIERTLEGTVELLDDFSLRYKEETDREQEEVAQQDR